MNILHEIKSLPTCFLFLSFLFASCSEEQTSLTLEDIPGRAKVIGKLTYNAGEELNAKTKEITQKILPASNKKVTVTIPKSYLYPVLWTTLDEFGFPSFNTVSGSIIYEGITNGAGEFSIEIPAVTNGILIGVKAETYAGQRSRYEIKYQDGESIYVQKLEEVIYRIDSPKNFENITPNDIVVADLYYNYYSRNTSNYPY